MAPVRTIGSGNSASTDGVTIIATGLALVIFPILLIALCVCCEKKKKEKEDGVKQSGTVEDQPAATDVGKPPADRKADTVDHKAKRDEVQRVPTKVPPPPEVVTVTVEEGCEKNGDSSGLSPPPDMRFDTCTTISGSSAPYVKLGGDKTSYRKLTLSVKTEDHNVKSNEEKQRIREKTKSVMDRTKLANEKTRVELTPKSRKTPPEQLRSNPGTDPKASQKSNPSAKVPFSSSVEISPSRKTASSTTGTTTPSSDPFTGPTRRGRKADTRRASTSDPTAPPSAPTVQETDKKPQV